MDQDRNGPPGLSDERARLYAVGALALATAAVSFLPRWWFFQKTAGLLHGVGTEEAFRLSFVYAHHATKSFPPFPTVLARFFHALLPKAPYITRWISLAAGTLTPPLLFLSLKRFGLATRFAAGFGLALSADHVFFSTTGTAEALSFLLLVLLAWVLESSFAVLAARRRRTLVRLAWIGVFVSALVVYTRFENWIVLPLLFVLVALRLRKFTRLYAFVWIAPLLWLLHCRLAYGSFFASAHLVPAQGSATVVENMSHVWQTVFAETGAAVLLIAFAGLLVALLHRPAPVLLLFGGGVCAAMLSLALAGKITYDDKYAFYLSAWIMLFASYGIGRTCSFLERGFLPASRRQAAAPSFAGQVCAVCLAALVLAVICAPALSLHAERRLAEEGTALYLDDALLLKKIEHGYATKPDQGKTYFLTSYGNRHFVDLYGRPKTHWVIKLPVFDPPQTVSALVEGLIRQDDEFCRAPLGSIVVTESRAWGAPWDDLVDGESVGGRCLLRKFDRLCGFRLYHALPVQENRP